MKAEGFIYQQPEACRWVAALRVGQRLCISPQGLDMTPHSDGPLFQAPDGDSKDFGDASDRPALL